MTGIPKLYNCKIMIISILSYRFCIFILSYLLSFLVFFIFVQPGPFLSYNLIHIHICRPKQTKSCVQRTKEEWIQGIWMKGGGPCNSSWMFWSMITFPCPSVCPPPQVCHDHERSFSHWNLSRDDMSLPNGSIIFCPTNWNAHVMTGAGAAMLDQR